MSGRSESSRLFDDRGSSTSTLERVVSLWRDYLDAAEVGPDDDFLELGGESLLAVLVVDEINELYGTRFDMGLIYESPTPRSIASRIDECVDPART